MKSNLFSRFLLFLLALTGSFFAADAQNNRPDTNYIRSYDSLLVGRLYFSQKYTTITLRSDDQKWRYLPNTTLNVGIGATYRFLSINLAYKAPGLNNDGEKGKTRYLDLQAHLYPRHWVIDFYGQNYKGYYADAVTYPGLPAQEYYVRPDVKLNLYGLAAYRLSNGNRFTFKAPFLQNEWQRRSAGTWLYGVEVHGAVLKADSSIVPAAKAADFAQYGIDRMRWLQIGPGGGYAYTLVIGKHFFATAAATVNLHLGWAETTRATEKESGFTISPNFIFRGAVGYNSDRWIVSFTNTPNRTAVRYDNWQDPAIFSTGNFRFNIAHRFVPGPSLRRKLRLLDPK